MKLYLSRNQCFEQCGGVSPLSFVQFQILIAVFVFGHTLDHLFKFGVNLSCDTSAEPRILDIIHPCSNVRSSAGHDSANMRGETQEN